MNFLSVLSIVNIVISYLIALPINAAWLRQLWSHRKEEFIRLRGESLHFSVQSIFVIGWVCVPFLLLLHFVFGLGTITVYHILQTIWFVILHICYGTRFYHAWYAIRIRQIMIDWAWQKLVDDSQQSLLLRYQSYFNNNAVRCFLAIVWYISIFGVSFGITVAMVNLQSPFFIPVLQMLIMILAFLPMISWVITICKVDDCFNIRNEFFGGLVCAMIWGIAHIASLFIINVGYNDASVFVSFIGYQWAVFGCCFLGSFWIVEKDAQVKACLESDSLTVDPNVDIKCADNDDIDKSDNKDLFKQTLSEEVYFRAFATHLLSEYSCENLLFIIEVLQYKSFITHIWNKCERKLAVKNNRVNSQSSNAMSTSEVIPIVDGNVGIQNIFDSDIDILRISWLPKHELFHTKSSSVSSLPVQRCVEALQYITEKYVAPSSAFPVNVPSQIISSVMKKTNEIKRFASSEMDQNKTALENLQLLWSDYDCYSIFDTGYAEIWKVLQCDPFFRFTRSEEYLKISSV